MRCGASSSGLGETGQAENCRSTSRRVVLTPARGARIFASCRLLFMIDLYKSMT